VNAIEMGSDEDAGERSPDSSGGRDE